MFPCKPLLLSPTVPLVPLYVPKHTVDQNTALDAILDHKNHHTLKQTSLCQGFRVQMSLQYGKEKKGEDHQTW